MATLLAGSLLAGCSADDGVTSTVQKPEGEWVEVTVNATIAGPQSRSTLAEMQTGGLKFAFSDGDCILITNAQGYYIGSMTVPEGGGGSATATLKGNVQLSDGSTEIHAFMFGAGVDVTPYMGYDHNSYALPLASQSGAETDMAKQDVMSCTAVATKAGNYVAFTLNLERRLAFVHRKLIFPEGAGSVESVTITGTAANYKLLFDELTLVKTSEEQTPITITGGGNELYYALRPGNYQLTFTATMDNGQTWTKTIQPWQYDANMFYSNGYHVGNTVTMQHPVNYRLTYLANCPAEAQAQVTNLPAEESILNSIAGTQTFTVTTSQPALDGYKFIGWKDAQGNTVAAGDQITLTDNYLTNEQKAELSAQWETAQPSIKGTASNITAEDF